MDTIWNKAIFIYGHVVTYFIIFCCHVIMLVILLLQCIIVLLSALQGLCVDCLYAANCDFH